MVFTQAQLEKYAEVLIFGLYTAGPRFKPYDTILVRLHVDALPLAEVLYRKLVKRKFNVVMRFLGTPPIEKDFYSYADAKQRRFVNAGEKELYESLSGLIALRAPASLTHLKEVNPQKIGEALVAKKFLKEILDRREAQGKFSWTLCSYPTQELARNAKLSMREYADQIIKACFLNDPDPVSKWRGIYRRCNAIKDWLKSLRIDTLNVVSKSMDLHVLLGEKRLFLGGSGRNIPSFEVFTSPDWRGTRGVYYADFPSFMSGNYVRGVRLEFKNGRAVKVSAEQGEPFTRKMLSMDEGACQVGEFSLTDVRFSKIDRFMADTLFDENVGGRFGNCHVAVGSAYLDTFDGNPAALTKEAKKKLGYNDSSLHWDLVNTQDKTVFAKLKNGKTMTIYERGEFCY